MAESTTFISRNYFDIEVEINQQELGDLTASDVSDLLWNVEEEVEVICEDLDDVFEQFEEDFILETLPSIPPADLSSVNPSTNTTATSSTATNISTTATPPIKIYTCLKCSKIYKRKGYYEKHVSSCETTHIVGVLSTTKMPLIDPEMSALLEEDSLALSWQMMEEASKDVMFNLNCGKKPSPGNITAALANNIIKNKTIISKYYEQFHLYLISLLMPILSINSKTVLARMTQCSNIHKVSEDEELAIKWDILINQIECNTSTKNMLLQFIIMKMYEKLLLKRNIILFKEEKDIVNIQLSKEEQKNLRYVAGFIPFSLSKKYKNKSGDVADSVRKLLNSWRDNVNSDATSHPYLEHTKSWVESKNEGGLFLVNHEFYLFI